MDEQGRSVVEILMVMAIVLVISALSGAGLLAATTKYQGRVVATDLANELRAVRYLAIMRREPLRVILQPGTSNMRVEPVLAPGQQIRTYDFQDKGVTIEALSSGSEVLFHPSGRAASPATITLRNRQQQRWQLTVSLIGRVSQL